MELLYHEKCTQNLVKTGKFLSRNSGRRIGSAFVKSIHAQMKGKAGHILGALFLVFSLKTVLEFQIRAGKIKRGKRTWATWLKAHGLE